MKKLKHSILNNKKNMLFSLAFLLMFLSQSIYSIAQQTGVTGEQRGMYVNRFITTDLNNDYVQALSILGNIPAEDALLNYCMDNHITYLLLYDTYKIFRTTSNQTTLVPALQEFICKARSQYCIQYVGATIGENYNSNLPNIGSLKTAPITLYPPQLNDPNYAGLLYLQYEIPSDDPDYIPKLIQSEILKQAIRLAFIDNPLYTGVNNVANCNYNYIDIITSEYEFWNSSSGLFYDDGNTPPHQADYIGLINQLDNIRFSHPHPLFIESYLGILVDANIPTGANSHLPRTHCEIGEFIDGLDPLLSHIPSGSTARRRIDRILAHYYSNDPTNIYNDFPIPNINAQPLYRQRFRTFGNANVSTCVTGINLCNTLNTVDNTDYHPIFSAESPSTGGPPLGSNFLGTYFPLASNRNIFTAERDFYEDFANDNFCSGILHDANLGNRVLPGACQWFAQSYMQKTLGKPITFLSKVDGCPPNGGNLHTVQLNYQGPIEVGNGYSYSMVNSSGTSFIPSTGNPSGTVNYPVVGPISGATGVNALTYNLPPDTYTATLLLTYPGGCSYSYAQTIIIDGTLKITALNQSNATGPISNVCGGNSIWLQANWNIPGANYTWLNNGIPIPGAPNAYELSISSSGNYSCQISNVSCSGSSNTIQISYLTNPDRFIVASCGNGSCSNGNNVALTVYPNIGFGGYSGPETYLWSTGASTSSISVCDAALYSVLVSHANGCTSLVSKNVTNTMLLSTSSPTAPVVTPGTSSICIGSAVTLSSTPTPFMWSNFATSSSISVVNSGIFFAIARNNQCESISNPAVVNVTTPSTISITASAPSLCNPQTQTVSLTATGGGTYSWTPGAATSTSITVNPNVTTTYTVTSNQGGCTQQASATVNVVPSGDCFIINKTVKHSITYAGMAETFTITMCNNTASSADVFLTDVAPPDFILQSASITLNLGGVITHPSTIDGLIHLEPGCNNILTYSGYFTNLGNCLSHVNTVTLRDASNSIFLDDASACVDVKRGCPMITYGNADCNATTANITLGIHTQVSNVKSIDLMIVYPGFITPPLSLTSSTLTSPFAVDYSASTYLGPATNAYISNSGTNPVQYLKRQIHVEFVSPVSVNNGPYWFFNLVFDNSNSLGYVRPLGFNSFLLHAATYRTTLNIQGGAVLNYWTQGFHVFFHGCPDAQNIDKAFLIGQQSCANPGQVTVSATNTSPTAVHIWQFGDFRSTPINGAESYMWDYYAPHNDNSGVTQAPPPYGNYTFKIKHIIDDNGVFGVDSQFVNIGPSCCEMNPDITINEYAKSSDFGSGLSNQIIFLNGTLDIDQSFYLADCNVIAAPGSVIHMNDGVEFFFNNTHFLGCTGMWQGIIAGNDCKIISDIGSSISDAQTGITVPHPNGYLSITDCDFTDNIVGIYAPENPDNSYYNLDYSLLGNTFTSTGNFKTDYNGQPAHGIYSKAGIEFNNMLGTIGNYGYMTNHFSQMNAGIMMRNCNIMIQNNDFKEIHSEDDENYGPLGGAVMATAGDEGYFSVDVAPCENQTLANPTVYNCDNGVVTSHIAVNVHDCKMVDVGKGVVVTNTSNDLPIEVIGNGIYANFRGVFLSENTGSHYMKVDNNYIKTDHSGGIGIDVSESSDNNSMFYAQGNSIYGIEHNAGIKATNIDGESHILENVITTIMANGDETAGIVLEACYGMRVSCNDIKGESSSNNYYTYGIHQSISQRMSIHCNSTDNTYVGIEFDGVNPETDFKTNLMYTHQEGLHLNSYAIIDAQIQAGNKWEGPFGNGGSPAYAAVNANYNGIGSSPFYVNAFSGPEYFPSVYPSTGWFGQQSGSPVNCSEMEDCTRPNSDVERAEMRTMLDLDIANGNINTIDFTPESRNMAKHYLYEKLKANPALLSEAVMQSFYNTHSTSPVGKSTIVKEDVKEMSSYDAYFKNTMHLADSLVSLANDSLQLIDSLRKASGNSSSLDVASLSLHNRINVLHSTIKTMSIQRESMRTGERAYAEINNSNVLSSMVPEQNEKLLTEIHLASDASGLHTYNATQESQLLSIAQQCPYSGGEAVYKARIKYLKLHPNTVFDDRATCLAEGIFRKANPQVEETADGIAITTYISIWPNPTKANATVAYTTMGETDCKLQITDLTGKLIREISLPCKQNRFTFGTENLDAGFYVAKVMDNGSLIGKSKFGIIK
ncbi:MAG: T9SS type A sorting domain-containing protein [Bacteroidetes bacterium]|nr:T9SS type A sorting domain-containing protein [Bacteroidota bacterium]